MNGQLSKTNSLVGLTLSHYKRQGFFFPTVPERPPLYITYSSPSSTTLLLHWAPIQPQFKNGIIRGFKVEYQENQPNATVEVRERRLINWVLLGELKKFTVYFVRVRAFTDVGDGPENSITVITSQDGKTSVFPYLFSMGQLLKDSLDGV